MPVVTVWMIRFSMLWMVAGALLGMLHYGPAPDYFPVELTRLHAFVMQFGWILQFTIAVAWWIFPRTGRNKRPSDRPMWVVMFLFQTAMFGMLAAPEYPAIAHILLLAACLITGKVMAKRIKKRGHTT